MVLYKRSHFGCFVEHSKEEQAVKTTNSYKCVKQVRKYLLSYLFFFNFTMFCNIHREFIKVGTFVGYKLFYHKAIWNMMEKHIKRANKPNNILKKEKGEQESLEPC